MQDVSTKEGRTVLFVSHNMNAVESLCNRVALMKQGKLLAITNDVAAGISKYLAPDADGSRNSEWVNSGTEFANPWFQPTRFYIADQFGSPVSSSIRNDSTAYVHIEGEVQEEDVALCVGYCIYTETGVQLYWSYHTDSAESEWPRIRPGSNHLRSRLPQRLLNQGDYRLELIISLYFRQWISSPGDRIPTISLSIRGGLSDSPYWMVQRPGILAPSYPWLAGSIETADRGLLRPLAQTVR
jgi:lipopolysaccharide transport system ATP-binding protein